MKFKNDATEKLCNEIADVYLKDGHVVAMKQFQAWCDTQKLVNWEYVAIVERIKNLILQKKGNLK